MYSSANTNKIIIARSSAVLCGSFQSFWEYYIDGKIIASAVSLSSNSEPPVKTGICIE